MYTEKYLAAVKKVEELESAFKANKSKKTATPLMQSRVELEKVSSYSQKFTLESKKNREKKPMLELAELIIGQSSKKQEVNYDNRKF